jgi:hypothetical protein
VPVPPGPGRVLAPIVAVHTTAQVCGGTGGQRVHAVGWTGRGVVVAMQCLGRMLCMEHRVFMHAAKADSDPCATTGMESPTWLW